PNDMEFYLCGRLESHQGVDFRSPIRTDCSRYQQARRMEMLYLAGPHGPTVDGPLAPAEIGPGVPGIPPHPVPPGSTLPGPGNPGRLGTMPEAGPTLPPGGLNVPGPSPIPPSGPALPITSPLPPGVETLPVPQESVPPGNPQPGMLWHPQGTPQGP